MTTDNRTNEPSEALIAEAKRRARKRRGAGWLEEADMLDRLIAALTAAGVAPQEVIDDAADEQDDLRMHMLAPQEPIALDHEKVAAIIWDLVDVSPERQDLLARALCEAYTEGKLT